MNLPIETIKIFLRMGGYAAYVWPAYILVITALAINAVLAGQEFKRERLKAQQPHSQQDDVPFATAPLARRTSGETAQHTNKYVSMASAEVQQPHSQQDDVPFATAPLARRTSGETAQHTNKYVSMASAEVQQPHSQQDDVPFATAPLARRTSGETAQHTNKYVSMASAEVQQRQRSRGKGEGDVNDP